MEKILARQPQAELFTADPTCYMFSKQHGRVDAYQITGINQDHKVIVISNMVIVLTVVENKILLSDESQKLLMDF